MSSAASVRAVNRWSSRIIPVVLAGCIGFATYVVSKRICGKSALAVTSQCDTSLTSACANHMRQQLTITYVIEAAQEPPFLFWSFSSCFSRSSSARIRA